LLLVDESQNVAAYAWAEKDLLLIPPFPRPAYGEQYKVGGEGVRLFFVPANRLHRLMYKVFPDRV
jgi:hypothetical protein